MNSFISSIGSTGFQTLPGGRIEQWGQNTITYGGESVITLPMAVPNGVLHSIVTFQGSQGNTPESVWISASTKTTITISHAGDNTPVVTNWRIICN
ncbi:gp53-like domain-containing protein [Escherichia coli]